MASMTAFDPSQLDWNPRQIRDEKIKFQEFLDSFPKDAFMKKIEGEEFNVVDGWRAEGNADASSGQVLTASYGDGLAAESSSMRRKQGFIRSGPASWTCRATYRNFT